MHDLTKTQVHLQLSLPPPHTHTRPRVRTARQGANYTRMRSVGSLPPSTSLSSFSFSNPLSLSLSLSLFLSVPHYSFSLPKAFCECIFSMVNPQWRSVVLTPHWQSYKCHAVHFEDLVDTPCYICAL